MHPWSIGGGGAGDLRESLETNAYNLASVVDEIGSSLLRAKRMLSPDERWAIHTHTCTPNGRERTRLACVRGYAWCSFRTKTRPLSRRKSLVIRAANSGRIARRYGRVQLFRSGHIAKKEGRGTNGTRSSGRLRNPCRSHSPRLQRTITLLSIGAAKSSQTAPVVKLSAKSNEDEHLGLIGLLNSSTVCFWLKQVCHSKGVGGIGGGIGDEGWEPRYAFNGTKVGQCPVPAGRPLARACRLDGLARELASTMPRPSSRRATPSQMRANGQIAHARK